MVEAFGTRANLFIYQSPNDLSETSSSPSYPLITIFFSWFDRDLSIAGRVVVNTGSCFETRLIKIDRPILRIPTLAIHLNREVAEGFSFNKETHLLPVLSTAVKDALVGSQSQA